MTEEQQTTTPESSTPPDFITAVREADERAQAEYDERVAYAQEGPARVVQEVADAEKKAYIAAIKPTREAPGYQARHQAYDRVRLAFIEGTAADTTGEALKLAKALPAYADAASGTIETRPI